MGFNLIAFMVSNWKPLMAAALVLGLYGTGYFLGRHAAALACERATQQAVIAAQNRDLMAQTISDVFQGAKSLWLNAQIAALQEESDRYEDELSKRSATARCPRYSPADVERLRKLRAAPANRSTAR